MKNLSSDVFFVNHHQKIHALDTLKSHKTEEFMNHIHKKEKHSRWFLFLEKWFGTRQALWFFTLSQVLYYFLKLIPVLWIGFSESPITVFLQNQTTFPYPLIQVLVTMYFSIIALWLIVMIYAIYEITKRTYLTDKEMRNIFWERVFNSHKIRKHKPQRTVLKLGFYMGVIIIAPWIWLTAIPRFIQVRIGILRVLKMRRES